MRRRRRWRAPAPWGEYPTAECSMHAPMVPRIRLPNERSLTQALLIQIRSDPSYPLVFLLPACVAFGAGIIGVLTGVATTLPGSTLHYYLIFLAGFAFLWAAWREYIASISIEIDLHSGKCHASSNMFIVEPRPRTFIGASYLPIRIVIGPFEAERPFGLPRWRGHYACVRMMETSDMLIALHKRRGEITRRIDPKISLHPAIILEHDGPLILRRRSSSQ